MGITTNGLSILAANMTGSALIVSCAVGTSGLTYAIGNTALGSEFERNIYSSADLTTTEQITFTTDWSPTEISGLILKEHGMFTTGSVMLNREVLTGSLVFTGEEECQVQQTIIFKI